MRGFFLRGTRRGDYNTRTMFPVFDPRAANLVLGMAICLSVALVWHVIVWSVVH